MKYILFVENVKIEEFKTRKDLEIYLHEYSFDDKYIRVEERRFLKWNK